MTLTRQTAPLFEDPDYHAAYRRLVPLGRLAAPADDIAPAYVYLASDDAAYVTGMTLTVDGGLTAGIRWPEGMPEEPK